MNQGIGKILLLLASSDVSRSEIRNLSKWLKFNGPLSLEKAVSRLRQSADAIIDFERDIPDFSIRKLPLERSQDSLSDDNLARQIEHLLIKDAGFTAKKASTILSNKIVEIFPDAQKEISQLNKEKFTKWVSKLSRLVPYNILLRESTRIRNTVIHRQPSDWPLRER